MRIEAEKVKVEKLNNGKLVVMTDEDAVSEKQLSDLEPGTTFIKGDKKMVVLEQTGAGTKVAAFDTIGKKEFDKDTNDWKASSLRNYLNTDLLHEYENVFGAENIVESETDLTTLDGLKDFGTCEDKIRLLTFEERRKYQELYKDSGLLEWTVTPWSTKERGIEKSVCCVSSSGNFLFNICYRDNAVRPFCILKSEIFVSVEGE